MTLMDVAFRYGAQPTEDQERAMARMREVYGIWRMTHDKKERVLRVEYDGSRLSNTWSLACCEVQVSIS